VKNSPLSVQNKKGFFFSAIGWLNIRATMAKYKAHARGQQMKRYTRDFAKKKKKISSRKFPKQAKRRC